MLRCVASLMKLNSTMRRTPTTMMWAPISNGQTLQMPVRERSKVFERKSNSNGQSNFWAERVRCDVFELDFFQFEFSFNPEMSTERRLTTFRSNDILFWRHFVLKKLFLLKFSRSFVFKCCGRKIRVSVDIKCSPLVWIGENVSKKFYIINTSFDLS